ncbi:S8 family serine peptidase [Myxosarcina sp. GI1]|uniref:S8 family serine peptidase n=1 Tax=Myxosarcina sp. GI1 TaxID=1541065 RepID=UPI00068ABCDD|nr:S8 family serine peptidase [Myxosarcina sp. GI1]
MAIKDNKSPLAIELLELSKEYSNFTGKSGFKSSNKNLILDETGEQVLVRITTGRRNGFVLGSNILGFTTEDNDPESEIQFIEEFIPIENINTSLETKLENRLLLGVVPVYESIAGSGNVTSQADFIHEANRVRKSLPLGYDGTGIKIGVLSDSYNSKNGAAGNIASGDLPNDVTVISRNGELQDISNGSDEGRAMLQLIHDLAPEADLLFATAFTGESNFANNIRALAEAGADIIVDDVVYFGEPFFQDGIVSLAVEDVVNDYGVAYFSSAGNNASKSYKSDNFAGVADTNLDNILEQDPNLDDAMDRVDANGNVIQGDFTVSPEGYSYHDFDPNANSVDNRQQIRLNNGQRIRFVMQWDDPFYTAGGVDTDIDLFLLDSNNKVVAYSFNDNVNNRTPLEYLDFANTSGSSQNYDLVIGKYSGSDPGRLKYINFGSSVTPEYFTNSSTIYGHAAAANAEAVGAVPYYRQDRPESFTALGPTTFFYEYVTDTNGNPIAVVRKNNPEVRNKPDITAIDGTDTTFFGSDVDGNGFPNFFGTSAAAPHAAAIAALLKQAEPNLTSTEIYQRLQSSAIDIGNSGFDNLTGNGLINAYKAIYGEAIAKSLIFSDDFEDGDLPLVYKTNSNGGGRIRVTTNNNPVGNYHLTLDNSFANVNSLNEFVLDLDTTDYSDIQLSFDQKEFNDNDHAMANSFTGSVNADGVALSVDGNTWYRLISLTGSNSTNTYQTHAFNLDDFADFNNLTLGSNVKLKFQQYGLNPINSNNSSTSDGMAFDNIVITGTLNGSNSKDRLTGGIEDNSIAGQGGKDRLNGREGNDTLSGGDDNDLVAGEADNDVLNGDNGSDRVYGDAGDDVVSGDDVNDLLKGGDGNDSLAGGEGNDRLYGENDSDTLAGGNGRDILYGGAGDDFIDGGALGDRLFGNGGADTFVLRSGDGSDLIYDYADNHDTFGLADSLSFEQLAIAQNGSNTEIKVQSTDELLARLYSVDASVIDSGDFNLV